MSRTEQQPAKDLASGTWRLHDWERPFRTIDSDEDLERMIRELPEKGTTPNRIVDLESPRGEMLSFGIAGSKDVDNPDITQPIAYLQLTHSSLNPPYLVPIGDASLCYENGGVAVFRYEGSWTEILKRNCVPVDTLVRIVQHFYRTGTLPDWIAWEEV